MGFVRGSVALCVAISIAPVIARADAVWIAASSGAPLKADGVRILRVDGDALVYNSTSGTQITKPLAQVAQLEADDEPAFNAAEQAYRDGKFADAVDQYQK